MRSPCLPREPLRRPAILPSRRTQFSFSIKSSLTLDDRGRGRIAEKRAISTTAPQPAEARIAVRIASMRRAVMRLRASSLL